MATYRRSNYPWIYDIACFFGGVMTLFLIYSNKVWLETKIQEKEKFNLKNLLAIGVICGFVGSFFYPLIGIWSSERDLYNELHGIMTLITFGGFILNAVIFGILFLLLEKNTGTILIAILTLVIIPVFFLLYFFDVPIGDYGNVFEWFLLFSILLWMISSSIFSLWEPTHNNK
jgi:hypothetical protein